MIIDEYDHEFWNHYNNYNDEKVCSFDHDKSNLYHIISK